MNSLELFINLAKNVSLLLAIAFIFEFIRPRLRQLPPLSQQVLQGVVFGVFGLLIMLSPTRISDDFMIDGRSVIVAIAGAFGGGIPVVLAGIIMGSLRVAMGGGGVVAGLIGIATAAGLGYGFRLLRLRYGTPVTMRSLLMLGLLTATAISILILAAAGPVLARAVVLPYFAIVPTGIMLLGWLLMYQQRQFEMEEALRDSEERYRSVITTMTEGVIVHDSNGIVTTCNVSAERILGIKADHMIGSSLDDLRNWHIFNQDGSPVSENDIPPAIVLRTGLAPSETVMGFSKPDGSVCWVLVNSRPLIKPTCDMPYAVVTTLTDMTQYISAQEALTGERDLLRTLIDSTPDYIFIKDAAGRFVISNEAHAKAVNLDTDMLVGRTAFDMFPAELAEQFHADDLELIENGQPLFNLERTTIDSKGKQKTVLTTKVPLKGRDGQITGLVGISRDITERKLLERQTLELKAERERLRVIQRFIGDISHDFRTPLSIINNSLYLLGKVTDDERRLAQAEKIGAQVSRMDDMLDDLLRMEYLSREDTPLALKPMDINVLVQGVVTAYESVAMQKQHQLQLKADEDIPILMIDDEQVQQALASIVENAMHYTPPSGNIDIVTSLYDNEARIEVRDNGVGIADDDLPHIFEYFYRADEARSTRTGHSGLGLAIAKHIVESHGGKIEVESTLEAGSCFRIVLPLTSQPETALQRSIV